MEAYIDDMLVKSLVADQHLEHLQQAFDLLIKYNMKLNPAKCLFGVASGKFLGVAVSAVLIREEDKKQLLVYYVSKSLLDAETRGSGLGIVLISPEGSVIQRAARCGFHATNNEAEYEALIIGLTLAKELKVTSLKVHSDSQLIVNQFLASFQAKDLTMTCYLELVKELQLAFVEFYITQIPLAENSYADALANLG
ncbi:uncharacterized protein Mb2253c-like [Tripterygium wilfordii]|uniref:uncharacterized protein Mb2253c-like n=1 Tax=Tripterygium wilfordii TaxID=458696 RepID=UPI0018F80798|nr:uncharacterized protein Mb2253c-like [Tripterygium wilfordii]